MGESVLDNWPRCDVQSSCGFAGWPWAIVTHLSRQFRFICLFVSEVRIMISDASREHFGRPVKQKECRSSASHVQLLLLCGAFILLSLQA